jgi:mannosyltransferase
MKFLDKLKENKWLALILVLATILRLYHLDFQSLWMDEIYTMNVSNPKNSFATIISEVNQKEGFPYLYFILIKIFLGVFGYTGLVARSFSAILGIISVYLIYKLGKEVYCKKTGLYAALLLTFSEFAIYYSQEARPYSFYLFGSILVFYGFVRFLKTPNLQNAIFYGLLAGLLLNISFFGFVILLSHAFIVLSYFFIILKEDRLNFIKNSTISGIITLVMFAPNYLKIKTLLCLKAGWIPPPSSESLQLVFKELLSSSEITLFIFVTLFLNYVIVIFKEKETMSIEENINNKKVFSFVLLFSWIFTYIIVFLLKSYLNSSILVSRYLTCLLPALLLIIAISINEIKNTKIRFLTFLCLISFMWINTDIVRKYYDIPNKTQYRESSNFVLENNKNNNDVYTNQMYWFNYYFSLKENKFSFIEKPTLEFLINEMIQNPTKKKDFWYVSASSAPEKLSGASQKYLDDNFIIQNKKDFYYSAAYEYVLGKNTIQNNKHKSVVANETNSIEALQLTNLSDSNWTGGVGIAINRFLLDYSSTNEEILKSASEIKFSNGKSIKINNYQVMGNFIQIEIDGKVNEYLDIAKYPNTISIK